VLALLMFAPYLFARMRHWDHVAHTERSAVRWLGGVLAFLAAAALWLVPMLLAVRTAASPDYQAYAHDILFHQTAGRYTDSWDHQQPAWYYLGVILTGWLPLTLALPGVVPRWRERLRQRDARVLLPLAWIVLIVVFFSFPKGKRDVYIMPALPLLALTVAPFLHDLLQRLWARRTAWILIGAFGIGFLGAGLIAPSGHWAFAREVAEQRGLADGGAALWWLLVALGAWTLGCALWFRERRGVHALLAGIAGMWLLWSFWAYPVLNDSSSAAGVMRKADALVGAGGELGLVAWKEQNLLMAERRATEFGFVTPWHEQLSRAIRWQEEQPASRWLFVLADAMAPCVAPERATFVGHANRREWWLFRADAVAPACRGGNVPASANEGKEDPNAN
jgi:4-amino-4-deoxy-L-arabinose transferase-like glycosyltransferase